MTCTLVAAQSVYITSICSDAGKTYALLTSCLSDCVSVGAYLLPEVVSTYKATYVGDSLVILSADPDPTSFTG